MWGDVLILYLSYLSLLTLTMSLFGLSLSLSRQSLYNHGYSSAVCAGPDVALWGLPV